MAAIQSHIHHGADTRRRYVPNTATLRPSTQNSVHKTVRDFANFFSRERASRKYREFASELREADSMASIADSKNIMHWVIGEVFVASDLSQVHCPELFEGAWDKLGFQWTRDIGDCYLYVNLENLEAQWVERADESRTENVCLNLEDGHADWDRLSKYLQKALSDGRS